MCVCVLVCVWVPMYKCACVSVCSEINVYMRMYNLLLVRCICIIIY